MTERFKPEENMNDSEQHRGDVVLKKQKKNQKREDKNYEKGNI